MEEGDHESADFCRMGGSWWFGSSGAGVCWQTVEDGLWFFPNVFMWIRWRWGTSMGAEWAAMGTLCWEPMRESYSGLAGNTYFVYLRTSALGMGQTVSMGKRNTLCCKSGMEIYFYLVLWLFIFYFAFYYIFCVEFLLNCQVMVTSLGRCCWLGRRVP